MNSRRFALAAALLLAACARPPATPSHEPRFVIELPGSPPSHILAVEGGGWSTPIPFSSLTEISWRAQTTDAPVTLQLDFSAEGDRARIVSYAIYPAGLPDREPGADSGGDGQRGRGERGRQVPGAAHRSPVV